MKLGGSKANAGQGALYECAFAVFKARRDFRYKNISIEELSVSVPNILYIPSDRAIDLSLFSDIFHWQERDLPRIGQNFPPFVRKTLLHEEAQTFHGPCVFGGASHPIVSRNRRAISSSAAFRSASISASGRGGVYR